MTADAPDFREFSERRARGEAQVVMRRLVSDLETPVSAYLKLTAADDAGGNGGEGRMTGGRIAGAQAANAFLLESVEGGEQLGRYSIIGMRPDAVWRANGAQAELNTDFARNPKAFVAETAAPLESLKAFIDASRIDLPDDAPPMAAGVFGYFGYDMARQIEHLPNRPPRAFDVDDAIMIRPTLVAVFDNIRQEIILVTTARPDDAEAAEDAYATAIARLDEATEKLNRPLGPLAAAPIKAARLPSAPAPASNTPPADYLAMVGRAREYIAAGDIFQVVLSQRFETPFEEPPFELYRALRRTNPSPFLFFLDFGAHALVGSSPEILVRVREGEITIRPIAGTRPRGKNATEDEALEAELLADPKERAEHLMLLDLGRNDAGRAAEIGSVRVTESFTIERYSHVMHIVSNVVARMRDDLHPVDAVAAGFPAGTVTGAPKIRAMEIIDELERDARGPYGGAIGYFSADGGVDTCIALRTALVKNGRMFVQAGAGVVADSVPANEHAECENKARALFAAAAAAAAKTRQ